MVVNSAKMSAEVQKKTEQESCSVNVTNICLEECCQMFTRITSSFQFLIFSGYYKASSERLKRKNNWT